MSAEPDSTQVPQPEQEPAAAPADPAASGEGETSFSDAQGPPEATALQPSGAAAAEPSLADAPADDEAKRYLALAQRTQADFENFRRRAARDASAASDRGKTSLAREILPALDHLDLALSAAEQDPAAAGFAKGVRLVQEELVKALGRAGIEAYSPLHEPFDPEQHEAMVQQPVEGLESGLVAEVYQSGYRLGSSVLRPARVVVSA